MKAFVFPGQGGAVAEPEARLLPTIHEVVGHQVPDQVKVFVRAAKDADESRQLDLRPDVVAGHSLGEYGAAYAAGCFDLPTGIWLVAQRDRFLAEAGREAPGGMVAILKADPEQVEKALGEAEGSVVANYNSPHQTVISGLRGALGDAVSRIRGRAVRLNVSFAAHSPYVAAASEKMREVLDGVEFRVPEFPIVSAVDGSILVSAEGVREALKGQMVAPVRWVKVVETLARMRVEEWVELGGGGVLTRMLRDFELPSLKGVTFEDLRSRLYDGAQNLLPIPGPPAEGQPTDDPNGPTPNIPLNVFFDVQGTLLSGNVPRPCVREVFEELGARGHDVYLWSSAGVDYATGAAKLLDVEDLVLGCWSKSPPPPVTVDYVVDDHRDFAEHHGGYAVPPFLGNPEDRELWKVAQALGD